MSSRKSLVGVFSKTRDVELALRDLRSARFPLHQVSMLTKNWQNQVPIDRVPSRTQLSASKAQQGTNVGAITGGTLGGTIGLVTGLGAAATVPALGPILLLGAGITALAVTLGGGVLGATAGGLLGALVGSRIPADQAAAYRAQVRDGGYLMIVEGSETEVNRAKAILSRRHAQELRLYDTTQQVPTV